MLAQLKKTWKHFRQLGSSFSVNICNSCKVLTMWSIVQYICFDQMTVKAEVTPGSGICSNGLKIHLPSAPCRPPPTSPLSSSQRRRCSHVGWSWSQFLQIPIAPKKAPVTPQRQCNKKWATPKLSYLINRLFLAEYLFKTLPTELCRFWILEGYQSDQGY